MKIIGLSGMVFACWLAAVSPVAAGDPAAGGIEFERRWTVCAVENRRCRLPYRTEVRYGANGVYVSRRMPAGSFTCGNATFGDPLVGKEKRCEYLTTTRIQQSGPRASGEWVFCADEGRRCFVPYTTRVRYGANGVYADRIFTSYATSDEKELGQTDFICGNAMFGDPLEGKAKYCQYMRVPSMHPLWARCAYENEFCAFAGARRVRFGVLGKYVELGFTNGVTCSTRVFGDPVPGKRKYCEVYR